ncbi:MULTISPECIES: YqjD family protein [unclassified Methylobacter]|uniref:DUF883 family protein n=1 Tax=unclassified Methylobacter TaxID=2635283 RepID=UPI001894A9CA|nr:MULTISPECIES: hypothetical protein [unclassified Methylobacter]MBF6649290.1 hypothetical protein [Methylobacter sp. BlB1]WAK03913.1 hypothetical protein LZ558_09040 [Methylobacter sp. YRD-M1]
MDTIDKLSSTAEEAAEKIASVTSQATEVLGEKGEQLKELEEQLMEDARDYIREHPITSMGIALAAGFMLSQITTHTLEHRR